MISNNLLVKILLHLQFNDGFIYFVKKNQNPKICDIFQIPFGKRKIFGVITEILDKIPENIAESKIKFA